MGDGVVQRSRFKVNCSRFKPSNLENKRATD